MLHEFSRAELLLGADALQTLRRSHVAVFGVGGVGSFACEALARAGVGTLTLIDNDTVSLTNRNRQLIALQSTIGQPKVEVMRERILDINPKANVYALQTFYTPDSALDLTQFGYIIDAIDTVTAKLHLITECDRLQVPLICSMGTGNKLDPARFEVSDIYKTSVCPLARVIRLECKKRRIKHLKVVYSKEEPRTPLPSDEQKGTAGRAVPGSVSFVPPVAGMILAGEVIKALTCIS
ncbi:tRNA threonylcarbamoyladenosine dehydratase [Agathobaculum sp.]|uniref:tRNA threonylcarbamoyladenosine dehydratase n=1 Tax=Agathobaculum sp. TaxID=2048138 RepID=UPI002A7F5F7E|nr:tRNA threonylcarbamoyladenosine dehydratase [Agathobaculum sp.]MDY3617816.1 tRNA threonylcarbamoyladenosine dehydratase [Agathobaculum sp.]